MTGETPDWSLQAVPDMADGLGSDFDSS